MKEEKAPKIEIAEKLGTDKNPLFVIDGVIQTEKEMKKIDPINIASVTVLKNENATNLYGSKAQDGVILITTKE